MDESVVMDEPNVSMDKSSYEVIIMDYSLCCGSISSNLCCAPCV
jgi:hypothetical protein